jgi:putative ubiquitin-RnfH superfamily antitoxin RatB of RatAB toxin-antitoxin module
MVNAKLEILKEDTLIDVQLCFATEQKQVLVEIKVQFGTTIQGAINLSELLSTCPEINFSRCKTGIFGKVKPFDTVLRSGDRIEIYRPLTADPMEARRRRAKKHLDK